jgi:replicative DNA helicase
MDQLADYNPPPMILRPTEMPALNGMLGGGIPERDLTLLIGPPGSGKSAWALAQAMQQTAPTLFVSTELGTSELKARIVAKVRGCSHRDVLTGAVSLGDQREALGGLPMRVIGSDILPPGTITERLAAISREVMHIHAVTGFLPMVIFDYVQDLARGVDREKSDVSPVGEVSRHLRTMAKSMGIPIIGVSSTSRAWYGPHPEITYAEGFLGAGKECGDLEFDAAVVLYFDILPEIAKDGSRLARIAVAKCRHATTGFIGVKFYGGRGGLWLEHPDSLQEFTTERKVEKQRDKTAVDDETAVLRRIASHGADPRGVLQHGCGIPSTRAGNAIKRLLESGKLEARRETRVDNLHKSKSVDVVGLPVKQ